jgi:CRP-like cAMP-binding protein/Fe-S-cluster-containing dehydrogenase component
MTGPNVADIERTERETQQRRDRLALLGSLDCLRTVPPAELENLVDLCMLRVFLAHETIIHERSQMDFLYLVVHGVVRLHLHDKEGREVVIGLLDRGDCFGGGELFGDFFRHAGGYAQTHCYVLQLPLTALRALLPTTPELHQALRQIYLQRLSEFTLARVPMFSRLSPIERLELTTLLKPKHYPRSSIVVRQGTPSDGLYIIEVGQVVIERDEQPIASLDEGDFFGEMSLLSNQPRNATVQTLTPTDILVLSAADFRDLLERSPDLEQRFQHVIAQRRRATTGMLHDAQDRAQFLDQVVRNGMLRGSHLLVRNPAMCPPGCQICEQACIDRHGHQRLRLNGVTIGQYDVADACRQCRVGAECVEACPEDALVWNDKGALYVNNACTGCGECVPACPYDAVERVPRTTETSGRILGRARSALHTVLRAAQPVIPLETVHYTHRANKCDLCHGYDDMVCVSACPTGALRYVPVEEILPL